jgi:hypothetical protein
VSEADEAQQRPVALDVDALRQPVRKVRAQLRFIAGKQLGGAGIRHAADSTTLSLDRPLGAAVCAQRTEAVATDRLPNEAI